MTKLHYTEFAETGGDDRASNKSLYSYPVASDSVAIGATSAQSAAFFGKTRFISITAMEDCFVELGSDPSAGNASDHSWLIKAGLPYDIAVRPGDKIAVIQY